MTLVDCIRKYNIITVFGISRSPPKLHLSVPTFSTFIEMTIT